MNSALLPDNLLLDLSDVEDDDLEEFARQKFREFCIQSGGRGMHLCHDGDAVVIWESRFDHAFFAPKNWQETSQKQILDKRRVERMPWILPLVGGELTDSECWLVLEHGRTKRMYILPSKGYILWLEYKYEGLWTFSTAYTANSSYIYKQTRGQRRIWKK